MTSTWASLHALAEAPRVTGHDSAIAEPSHIHIPRPSRVRQASLTQSDEQAAPVQLEVSLEEAA